MSDQTPPPPPPPPGGFPPPPPPAAQVPPPPPPLPAYTAPPGAPQQAYLAPMGMGPLGKVRPTGICILLAIVTLGIYTLVWWFLVHEELKKHTGRGLGGLVALLLAFFVGIVMPFFTSNEVGNARKTAGQEEKVTALTGLWYFPGIFILVGPIVWFVKTNGALNEYWASRGAPA